MKKLVFKSKIWDIPLYPGKLRVTITNDINSQEDYIKEVLQILRDTDHTEVYAHYVRGSEDDEMVHNILLTPELLKNNSKVGGMVAHESLHVVLELCDYIGIEVKADNPEPITYLLAWVVNRVYEVIDELNKK